MANNGNGYPTWPVPIAVIELYDQALSELCKSGKAKLFHDGSVEFSIFGIEPIKSKKFTKAYRVNAGDEKIITKLVFDYRDNRSEEEKAKEPDKKVGVGWIRVSDYELQLLKESKLLEVKQ